MNVKLLSNFVQVYIYAKGLPGINLGASHESCAHPSGYKSLKFCLCSNLMTPSVYLLGV